MLYGDNGLLDNIIGPCLKLSLFVWLARVLLFIRIDGQLQFGSMTTVL